MRCFPILRVVACGLLVVGCFGCVTETTSQQPGDAGANSSSGVKGQPDGGSIAFVPEIGEWFSLGNKKAWGFRYSGAPVQVSVEIFYRQVPFQDFDTDKKKQEFHRSQPSTDDRLFVFNNVNDSMVKSYESGKMTRVDTQALGICDKGKILFYLPTKKSDRTGMVAVLAESKGARQSSSQQFQLPDPGATPKGAVDGGGSHTSSKDPENRSIAPGESTTLISEFWTVQPDSKGPTHRIDYVMKVRVLRKPAQFASPKKAK